MYYDETLARLYSDYCPTLVCLKCNFTSLHAHRTFTMKLKQGSFHISVQSNFTLQATIGVCTMIIRMTIFVL